MSLMDNGGSMIPAHTWDIPGLYFHADFEDAAAGWTLTGDWEAAAPQGLGGSSGQPDPQEAYNNLAILGNDLTGQGSYPGDYEHSSSQIADSPSADASTWANTRLLLYRRINVRSDDSATLSVMKRNKETVLWSSPGTVSETDWSTMALDVSDIVDGSRDVRFRFRMTGDSQGLVAEDGVSSGWNIDDVIVKDGSLPDYAPCGGCISGPAFGGVLSAADVDACGGGGVTVSWDEAQAWGTGDAGTYAVYRDTDPGFTPSGGNGGLTDANLVRREVTDTTSQLAAAPVYGMTLKLVNDAHVRLAWQPATGADSYHIYRSDGPAAGFTLIGSSSGPSFEDLAQGGNANSWYYRVVAVNRCGEEGP
jgi:hypothetical protein